MTPFNLDISESALDDLRQRLAATRWPEPETVSDRSQGIPIAFMREMCDYWQHRYDWRRCEAMLNGFGQFMTEIDGLPIHFLHVRSPHEDALPLLITHGWPGSVIEFHKVIGPLTDPTAHGGKAEHAFHVIAPSLPGYGFSGRPAERGWTVSQIARAWDELMRRLGYRDYVAQGGDWGSLVTAAIGTQAPEDCRAIHINMLPCAPTAEDVAAATPEEMNLIEAMGAFQRAGSGYAMLQATRPQTIGYALVDSPVAQASWILEKFADWTDNDGDPRSVLSMDEMLDNVTLYWLTATGASSGRLYWEGGADPVVGQEVFLPMGCSMFPKEMLRCSRRWAERRFHNIIYWNEPVRGGHFAAFEQPALFVDELRSCFAQMR